MVKMLCRMEEVNLKKLHTAQFHFNDILKRRKTTEMENSPRLAEAGVGGECDWKGVAHGNSGSSDNSFLPNSGPMFKVKKLLRCLFPLYYFWVSQMATE